MTEVLPLTNTNATGTTWATAPVLLLKKPNINASYYSKSVIRSFALYNISRKKTCFDAQEEFSSNPVFKQVISDVYDQLTAVKCGPAKPTDIEKLKAKELLHGLTVK